MLTDRLAQPEITYAQISRAIDDMVSAVLKENKTTIHGVDGYPYATGTLMAMLAGAINQLDEDGKTRYLASLEERRIKSEQAYLMKQLSQKS